MRLILIGEVITIKNLNLLIIMIVISLVLTSCSLGVREKDLPQEDIVEPGSGSGGKEGEPNDSNDIKDEDKDHGHFSDQDYNILKNLEESARILDMDKDKVVDSLGQPEEIDYYGAEYYKYEDRIIFFEQDDQVSSIWWTDLEDLFNIPGRLTNEKVKKYLGKPKFEGIDEIEPDEYYLHYQVDNFSIRFINLDNESGYVHIKDLS